MKAKTVRESSSEPRFEPKEQFLEWLESAVDNYPDEDWTFVLSAMENDEASSDDEMFDHFNENGVDVSLIEELLYHRNGFLNYGLDIQL
jgi:hypothetical protein